MAQINVEDLKAPVHSIGGGDAGKQKLVLETALKVLETDPVVTDKEIAEIMGLDATDVDVIKNIRQHTYNLRNQGHLVWKGYTEDKEQAYIAGNDEKGMKKTKAKK